MLRKQESQNCRIITKISRNEEGSMRLRWIVVVVNALVVIENRRMM